MVVKIICNDCLAEMKNMADNSIDCIVTDPPYGLSFMSKDWDKSLPSIDIWKEALRIVKPGGHLLCFGGSRTYHRMTCVIEDAGWEIRDCLMWLYGSGFPKAGNISKSIDKALGLERQVIGVRPGHENFVGKTTHSLNGGWDRDWTNDPDKVELYHSETASSSELAKKFDGYSTALKPAYEPIIMAMKPKDGTFAENAERWGIAGINVDACRIESEEIWTRWNKGENTFFKGSKAKTVHSNSLGRWPSNCLFDEETCRMLDAQSGIGASRFFYCAKSAPSERHIHETFKNIHPTVKPLKLMEYLIKMVMPPENGVLLDPFAGSGSTIVASKNLGVSAIGIEMSEEYCKIANARIDK